MIRSVLAVGLTVVVFAGCGSSTAELPPDNQGSTSDTEDTNTSPEPDDGDAPEGFSTLTSIGSDGCEPSVYQRSDGTTIECLDVAEAGE